jgi:hypothetical protein
LGGEWQITMRGRRRGRGGRRITIPAAARAVLRAGRVDPRLLAMLAALLLGIPAAVAASAATTPTGTGWIRLAHLSPNTPEVDVYL